ncbi:hypothetical protein BDM02DRAFT_3120788 [Thelephora ganbajun]|uniref:Uncharacterized protein n=1 Tax=Thelephora ganbajun TaxID=370292 RepID=A0ACB6Z7I8_THEGA|nr:hypothetical protein BDM02DRAFT_3120788 [Thelephora ganbajun]
MKDPSHVPSSRTHRIADGEGMSVGEGSADRPAKTHNAKDGNVGMDLDPAPDVDEPTMSDPESSAKEPESEPPLVIVKLRGERGALETHLRGLFDNFHHHEASRGGLHDDISPDMIIYLGKPKKGGLLDLDPPIKMSGDFNPCPRQRRIPELEYDENGEVILGDWKDRKSEGSSSVPVHWYMKAARALRYGG